MDQSTVINIASLSIAILALVVSAVSATRQWTVMRQANQMSVVVGFMQEFRSEEFQTHERYLLNILAAKGNPTNGVAGQDEPGQRAINYVTSFFSALGMLLVHRIVDEAIVISMFGFRADRAWSLLEGYITRERELRQDPQFASPFEHLVARVRQGWPPDERYRLQQHQINPQKPSPFSHDHLADNNQKVDGDPSLPDRERNRHQSTTRSTP